MGKNSLHKGWFVALALAGLGSVSWIAQAGSLDPSAPPAPTKTAVDETDPRIPIRTGDLPLTISMSGSYYLAENISTSGNGITITADNVTVDLRGYTLSGGTGNGIWTTAGTSKATVRNGRLSGWGNNGVALGDASAVIGIVSASNVGKGIWVGSQSSVIDSIATDNGSDGVYAGNGALVTRCIAHSNEIGITAFSGSVISDSVARSNDLDGISGQGSVTVAGCRVESNGRDGVVTSRGSHISDTTAAKNSGVGIKADLAGTVINCTAQDNVGNGIQVQFTALVLGNRSAQNGMGAGDGAGIHATGSDNRIEGNTVLLNDRGIDVDSAGNVVIKNSASGNTTNYDIVAGNDVGPVGTAAASTSPWANILF